MFADAMQRPLPRMTHDNLASGNGTVGFDQLRRRDRRRWTVGDVLAVAVALVGENFPIASQLWAQSPSREFYQDTHRADSTAVLLPDGVQDDPIVPTRFDLSHKLQTALVSAPASPTSSASTGIRTPRQRRIE